jgi:uracil-DNA glycosylase
MMQTFNKLLSKPWADEFGFPYLSGEYFNKLGNYLNKEYLTHTCYPPKEDIFSMFRMLSPQNAQVVVVGQDVFHEKMQATGVAFAIPEKQLIVPPSLKIIENEVNRSIYNSNITFRLDYTLNNWINQGVFLFNTALSVREGQTGSHSLAWGMFTETTLNILNKYPGKIFLLWGKQAQSYEHFINSRMHYILKAPHPAAECYNSNAGFIGCNHFKKVNEIIEANNGKEYVINW